MCVNHTTRKDHTTTTVSYSNGTCTCSIDGVEKSCKGDNLSENCALHKDLRTSVRKNNDFMEASRTSMKDIFNGIDKVFDQVNKMFEKI